MFQKSKKQREFLWPKTLNIKVSCNNKSKYDLETVIKIIVSYIFNHQTILMTVINNDKLLDALSPEGTKLQAMISKTNNLYQLVIRNNPTEDIINIICHEMIHLNQIERGDLVLTRDMKTVTWKGKEYDYKVPYMERPWEIEAVKNTPNIRKQMRRWYYE